jgi:hypothetical protein
MSDTETIEYEKKESERHDDFPSIGMELFKKIHIKTAILLFIASVIIFSDFFVANVIPKSMVNIDMPDNKGTLLQLLLLTLTYIVIDLLVQGKVL